MRLEVTILRMKPLAPKVPSVTEEEVTLERVSFQASDDALKSDLYLYLYVCIYIYTKCGP